jgi:DNA invertase Pin-like site-specific DNA recombinase
MNTSELTKDGLAKAKARGVKMGPPVYGETPEERETIALVVALYAEGLTLHKVCDRLAELGRMTRKGKRFCVSTIHRILKQAQAAKRGRAPKAHSESRESAGVARILAAQERCRQMARERQH